MAKLPPQTLITVFNLQKRMVELIDEAKATEYDLFETFGETEATLIELEEINNGIERLRNPYSRLHTLALRIAEYQPTAPSAMLELLEETIKQAEASVNAVVASIAETKRNWNLP